MLSTKTSKIGTITSFCQANTDTLTINVKMMLLNLITVLSTYPVAAIFKQAVCSANLPQSSKGLSISLNYIL
jgi:hypothetical protein